MKLLDVKIDNLSYQEALEKSKKLLDSSGKHYIVTPNPEIVVVAQRDSEFKKILNEADLSIPDGIGVVLASSLIGERLKERVTGVDFLQGLAGLSAEHELTLFLLGAGEGVAERAGQVLKTTYPRLKITGTYSGSPLKEFDNFIRSELTGKKIDILVVAYGAPAQEKWISRNLPYLNVKLAIGVGGALDYLSGQKSRAPKLIQKVGLEWLFRLVREPSRFQRQLTLPRFVYLVLREKFKQG